MVTFSGLRRSQCDAEQQAVLLPGSCADLFGGVDGLPMAVQLTLFQRASAFAHD